MMQARRDSFGRCRQRRRGMAMMLVLGAIALASILGMALLSNSALQGTIGVNQNGAAVADSMAESGVNLAEYYLVNPAKAPLLNANGFYPGETGITLGSTVPGSIDLAVTRTGVPTDTYTISATGYSSGRATSRISRTVVAVARVKNSPLKYALSANASLTLNANVSVIGNVQAKGTLTVKGATVNGLAYALVNGGIVSGLVTGNKINVVSSGLVMPTSVTDYKTYEYFNGTSWAVYSAENLSAYAPSKTLGGAFPVTLNAKATNPAGIFWTNSDLTITSNVTVNGTLVLNPGTLSISGQNNRITPQAGFPAMVLNGNLIMTTSANSLTADGVVWTSGKFKNSGSTTGTQMTVNGAVIFGGSSASISTGFGTLTINYNLAKAKPEHLNTVNDGVDLLDWQQ